MIVAALEADKIRIYIDIACAAAAAFDATVSGIGTPAELLEAVGPEYAICDLAVTVV